MKNNYVSLFVISSMLIYGFEGLTQENQPTPTIQQEVKLPTVASIIDSLPEVIMTFDKDQKITKTEIKKELTSLVNSIASSESFSLDQIPELSKEMAVAKATIRVIAQKAKELGLKPDAKAVQEQINEMKKSAEGLAQLAVYGSEEKAKEIFSEYSMLDVYIDHEIIAKIKISDKVIEAYYNKYKTQEFIKETIGKKVSHILISDPDETKAKSKIEDIAKQLKSGKSFTELAKTNSDCGSNQNGGYIGIVSENQNNIDGDFLNIVNKTKVGEISEPFKSQFGYHILKIDGINEKETYYQLDEKVKKEIEDKLRYNATEEVVNKMYKEIKQDYHFKFSF